MLCILFLIVYISYILQEIKNNKMTSFFVDFQLGLKVNTVVCDITQWHADHNFRKQGT